jgi:anti-sigma-K factor RskA
MNSLAYISSGILELYANGLLSEVESREVEAMCVAYPEVKAELEKIQLALEQLALDNQRPLRRDLKQNILAKIQSIENQKDTTSNNLQGAPKTAKIVSISPFRKYAMAASFAAFGLSAALNLLLYKNLNNANDQIVALQSENAVIVKNNDVIKVKLDKTQESIASISNAAIQKIVLKGVPTHTDAELTIFWNSQTSDVYSVINTLPEPPKGMQYQLWALDNGTPIDAGMLSNNDEKTIQKMKNIANAQAFAITLEVEGGVASPTLTQMYAMGKAI